MGRCFVYYARRRARNEVNDRRHGQCLQSCHTYNHRSQWKQFRCWTCGPVSRFEICPIYNRMCRWSQSRLDGEDLTLESVTLTYQEHQFSTRSLVFIHSRIFFECATATFGEANPDRPVSSTKRGVTRSINFTQVPVASSNHAVASFLSYYHHVPEYTSRSLSYKGDILNAFSAILHDHSTRFETSFCWGLPTQQFLFALMWTNGRYSDKSSHPLKRRTGIQKGCSPFPSWSWAG